MKIILKDYKTKEFVSEEEIVDVGEYVLARPHATWYKEYASTRIIFITIPCMVTS